MKIRVEGDGYTVNDKTEPGEPTQVIEITTNDGATYHIREVEKRNGGSQLSIMNGTSKQMVVMPWGGNAIRMEIQ